MISYTLLSFSLLVSTLAVQTDAAWFRHAKFHIGQGRNIGAEQEQESWYPAGLTSSIASTTASESYTFSVPNASIIAPTLTSQGMAVTSIVPIYEVCNTPGSNTTSCSTVFETITTTTCSTVLTYAFSQTTITDCAANVTFSTQSSFALATTTLPPSVTPAQKRQQIPPTISSSPSSLPSPTPTTIAYVQSVVSYWYAPWQSLAANNPQDITLLVCKIDYFGAENCTSVQEVWIVHTEYVLVSTTSTLTISTSLSSDAVFLLAPSQGVTATAGNFTLSTQILYSSMVVNATTIVSTLTSSNTSSQIPTSETPTSTTMSTTTITITGPPSTVTMTLNVSPIGSQPTTTYQSTTVLTSTVTVLPKMQKRFRERAEMREEGLAEALLLD
ncbi:uncharacterized protein LY89DRAFT_660500 [Mollisia scopiformis]|uniref:Uncharacterized protein n=1 Tax=Mollisia scopiformis TaxID=149040 RepID=A0A132B4B6_MOLSC|nr:uncharacterized protein LY89DRAFT_660500 [Mollisia scopiformis]KUJ07265.1 hypothetical protein LY89DRAFT_660500 [Mollisia scopiformis]